MMIFEGVNQLPNLEVLRKLTVLLNKKEEIKDKKSKSFLSRALRMRMTKSLRKQGLSNFEIEERIRTMADQHKKIELNKIEDLIKKM